MTVYIIQSRPDDKGRREFFRTFSPDMPTIKISVVRGWDVTTTSYDIDREQLLASGARRLGTSLWLNLSSVWDDQRPGIFEWQDWLGEVLAKLEK